MKNYYNMFQQTSARRASAIERITDPEIVTNYLCGYSLRICTLYLLWIHLVVTVSILCTLISAHAYVTIHFDRDVKANSTVYTVTANKEKLFNIDTYSKGIDGPFKLIFNKLVGMALSWAFLDVVTTVMALCGVYMNKLLMMAPYVIAIFTNIIWFSILLIFCEILAWLFNLMAWSWISTSFLTFLLLKDIYRFTVLYSYFHMVRGDCFPTPHRSPRYSAKHSSRYRSPLKRTTTMKTETSSEEPSSQISISSKASDKDSEDNG